jgi:hypothetical protein
MMSTPRVSRPRPPRSWPDQRPALPEDQGPSKLISWVLAGTAAAAAGASLLFPRLLGGTAVVDGNLRGTALVVLVLGVPLLLLGERLARRDSARGMVLWAGSAAYLTYQAVLFCFATPLNSLFLVYVAYLGAALWTLITLVRSVRLSTVTEQVDARMPARLVGGSLVTFAGLNLVAWLRQIVPTIGDDHPARVMQGSGLITSAVWVQDLAFWLPLAVVSGLWCWQRRAAGVLLAGAMLTFYVVECVSVASDQWWGARADSASPEWASMTAVPAFLGLAVLTALPLIPYYLHLARPTWRRASPPEGVSPRPRP